MNAIWREPDSAHGESRVSEELIDQVWHDLHERLSRARVRQVAAEIAAKFNDARITLYIPIFVRRQARERLQREVPVGDAAGVTESEPLPQRGTG